MTTRRNESAESPQNEHRTAPRRLTDAVVRDLSVAPGKKDRLVFDRDLAGFGVRVLPDREGKTRRRTFLFQYRAAGAVRRIVIGEWGTELTAAQARAKAERLRGEVRDKRDPAAERKAAAAAKRAAEAERKRIESVEAFTFDKMLDAWDARYLVTKRQSYRADALSRIRGSLASLLTLPAEKITRAEAARALQKAADERGRIGANRVMAYARAAFGWAVKAGLVAANPFAGLPQLAAEVPRDRVMSLTEVGAVWRAAGRLGDPHRAYVRILLLTLQRRQEVAGARWDEFDLDAGLWAVPGARAKNGRQHVVHLAPAAVAELRRLPRPAPDALVFALPGGGGITAFSAIRRRLEALIGAERAEADPEARAPEPGTRWTFHDFRRTGVSTLASMGIAPHVADRLLNHVTGAIQGVAAVYQRAQFLEERKAAVLAWAAFVEAAAAGRQLSPNVVRLRTGSR